jgi:hypothetical protein
MIDINKDLQQMKSLLADIHKLHFADLPKPLDTSLKDRFKREILLKQKKVRN